MLSTAPCRVRHSDIVPFMSADRLYKLCQRGRVRRVQTGGNGREALYDVESLPEPIRVQVYQRISDREAEERAAEPLSQLIEIDSAAVRYYSDYEVSPGVHLPNARQQLYAVNCAVLNAIIQLLKQLQSQGKVSLQSFWQQAAESALRLRDVWVNDLPTNPRSLQRKCQLYQSQGYESLIHRGYRNSNARKVDSEEQVSLLLHLLSHYNNLDDTMVARLYNVISDQQSWPQISASTVRSWRIDHQSLIAYGRKGETRYRSEQTMTVRRKRPTSALAMWSMDGWTCELLYQSTNGKRVTTYHNRMTVVVVLDVSCNYPIGYAIGEHESPALIKEALRNALLHTRELTGQMLRTNQLQSDHYAIKTLSPLYAAVAERVTPARVRNAKAKPVEAYFNYLNTTYCQTYSNWAGKGITTRDGKQPNVDALNALRKQFPDRQGIIAQISHIIEQERTLKHAEYMELLEALPAQHRLPLSRESYLLHYGETTQRTLAISPQGVRPTLLGIRREYDTFDRSWREHSSERWLIKYDPDDLSEVLAVNPEGTLRYMLQEKYVQPMALIERTEGDARELERVMTYNKELERDTRQALLDHRTRAAAVINTTQQQLPLEGHEQIKGLLGRLVLVDSKGQHKDERSRELRPDPLEADYTDEPLETLEVETSTQTDTPYDLLW